MTTMTVRGARDGFTLMEILIAVAIVAVMGVMVGPNLVNRLMGAKKTSAETNLKGLKASVQTYHMDNSSYPEKLRDLVKKPASAKKWNGPYIEGGLLPEDPWGGRYVYKRTPGGKHPYELYSHGPEGKGSPKKDWISVWGS